MRRLIVVLAAVVSLVGGGQPAGGETVLRLRDVIILPDGFVHLAGLTDLDGDNAADLVVWDWGPGGALEVLEREAGSVWAVRFAYRPTVCRYVAVADADQDGRPEIAVADTSSVVIYEATGDNKYQLVHQSVDYRSKIETVKVGDSNGNGRVEFLVTQEGAWVHMLESIADNSYKILGPLSGHGFDCDLAGVYDLDGDGEPSLIFHDNEGLHGEYGHTYVYKNGRRIFDQAEFAAIALGDTDGNGRQEMIGGTKIPKHLDDLVIVESLGDNRFQQVVKLPNWWGRDSRLGVQDVDGDGRTELLRRLPGPGGAHNVLSVATRDGQQVYEVLNSGDLFHDQNEDLRFVLAVDDTNGDGHRELLVVQGAKLHFLEILP